MMSNAPEVGLGTLLRQLLLALDGDVQAVYDDIGVPFRPRFYPIVRHLDAAGPLSVTQLAERVGVSQPAITQTLNEMRGADLVLLEPGEDRRARLVRLAPRGEAIRDRLLPVWRAVHAAAAGLDGELACPLSAVVRDALDRLAERPFRDRILEEMQ